MKDKPKEIFLPEKAKLQIDILQNNSLIKIREFVNAVLIGMNLDPDKYEFNLLTKTIKESENKE